MVTQVDHVANMLARLGEKRRALEAKIAKIDDLMRALHILPEELEGVVVPVPTLRPKASPTSQRTNVGNTAKVEAYIEGLDENSMIRVSDVIAYLKQHGVDDHGKPRSLDSQVRVILRKLEQQHRGVAYEPPTDGRQGFYYKPVREDGSRAALIPGLSVSR